MRATPVKTLTMMPPQHLSPACLPACQSVSSSACLSLLPAIPMLLPSLLASQAIYLLPCFFPFELLMVSLFSFTSMASISSFVCLPVTYLLLASTYVRSTCLFVLVPFFFYLVALAQSHPNKILTSSYSPPYLPSPPACPAPLFLTRGFISS